MFITYLSINISIYLSIYLFIYFFFQFQQQMPANDVVQGEKPSLPKKAIPESPKAGFSGIRKLTHSKKKRYFIHLKIRIANVNKAGDKIHFKFHFSTATNRSYKPVAVKVKEKSSSSSKDYYIPPRSPPSSPIRPQYKGKGKGKGKSSKKKGMQFFWK